MSNQERRTYSFKAAGETIEKRKERDRPIRESQVIGIKTPLELSSDQSTLFSMHKDLGALVRDNFRNMLNTNHGERLFHHDFGADLGPLAFELGDEQFDSIAIRNIQATTRKYMPFIELNTFESFSEQNEQKSLSVVGVRVTYDIPSIRVFNQVVETVIYVGG